MDTSVLSSASDNDSSSASWSRFDSNFRPEVKNGIFKCRKKKVPFSRRLIIFLSRFMARRAEEDQEPNNWVNLPSTSPKPTGTKRVAPSFLTWEFAGITGSNVPEWVIELLGKSVEMLTIQTIPATKNSEANVAEIIGRNSMIWNQKLGR